jgi:hypothetical protein
VPPGWAAPPPGWQAPPQPSAPRTHDPELDRANAIVLVVIAALVAAGVVVVAVLALNGMGPGPEAFEGAAAIGAVGATSEVARGR